MKKLEFKGDTAEIINYTFQAWLPSALCLINSTHFGSLKASAMVNISLSPLPD